jgi:glutaredoxin 3
MSQRVVVYVTDYCPYCTRAKSLLERRGIAYDEVDVSGDPEKRAWLVSTTKRRTVPQIFIDGTPVGGSDELHDLDRSGKLAEMMARTP